MKKFIILMITVISILGIAPCALAEGVPTIELDGSVVTVTNAPDNSTLIIAAYNNGILNDVQMTDGSGIITADVSQYLSKAERLKAFLWDMENIYPFGEPKEIVKEEPAQSNSTIILNMNGTDVRADLYDNKAANAFKEMLPYTVTVSRAADDLCGSVSENLPYDPSEDQDTWSIGEIGWFDGWFTILCDNEEGMPKRTRTIIGKIHDEDIPFMQSLTGSVEITARLADSENENTEDIKMKVQVGDKAFTATLEDNAAVAELVEMMKENPVTIQMNDYSGFEKVGPLGRSLTTSNVQTTTTAGDIVLYNGNQIVMFYGSNSWSYTRIGRIDDLTGWEDALGSGSVTVTFDIM